MNNVESAPDRILLSPAIYNKLTHKLVQKSLPSDHGEIYIHFRLQIDKANNIIKCINYNKANWELYQQMIQVELGKIDTPCPTHMRPLYSGCHIKLDHTLSRDFSFIHLGLAVAKI